VIEEEGECSFKAFTAGSVRITSPTALSLKTKIFWESIPETLSYYPLIFNSKYRRITNGHIALSQEFSKRKK
jgi:hypothetical protein